VQKRPINDHDYDSPSLEFAYAGNMEKNMLHICRIYATYMPHICHIYAPHISPNSAYFASKSSAYFKKILRYKPTSLNIVV